MGDVVPLKGLSLLESHREQLISEKPVHATVHSERFLDEVVRNVLGLADDELLPALEHALKLAINAKGQGNETSFYDHIMASNAITSRILLNGGRL